MKLSVTASKLSVVGWSTKGMTKKCFKLIFLESTSANVEVVNEGQFKTYEIVTGYELHNILNVNKNGMFYQAILDKTLLFYKMADMLW